MNCGLNSNDGIFFENIDTLKNIIQKLKTTKQYDYLLTISKLSMGEINLSASNMPIPIEKTNIIASKLPLPRDVITGPGQ